MNPVSLDFTAYFPRESSYSHPYSDSAAVSGPASTSKVDSVKFSSDDLKHRTTELNKQEKREVDQLEKRDTEVRTHEQQHKSAGGGVAGTIQLEYEVGPDGKQYAVGGEVKVDTSKEETPEKTIQKAQQIKRAALAPSDPSHQDHSVATKAQRMETEARQELNDESHDDAGLSNPSVSSDSQTSSEETQPADLLPSPNDLPQVIRNERTPEDTIQTAREIRHAALYDGDISASDRLAASTARRLEAEARLQIQQKQRSDLSESISFFNHGGDISQEKPHINLVA